MYNHILVPTDGSALSHHAVKHAIGLAKKLGAKITGLHVVRRYPPFLQAEGFAVPDPLAVESFERAEAARARKILDAVKKAAEKAGVECNTVTAAGGSPYEMIIKQAGKSKCDLIVMASHGRRGIQGLLLGSETAKVLTHGKIPVLVCH